MPCTTPRPIKYKWLNPFRALCELLFLVYIHWVAANHTGGNNYGFPRHNLCPSFTMTFHLSNNLPGEKYALDWFSALAKSVSVVSCMKRSQSSLWKLKVPERAGMCHLVRGHAAPLCMRGTDQWAC